MNRDHSAALRLELAALRAQVVVLHRFNTALMDALQATAPAVFEEVLNQCAKQNNPAAAPARVPLVDLGERGGAEPVLKPPLIRVPPKTQKEN